MTPDFTYDEVQRALASHARRVNAQIVLVLRRRGGQCVGKDFQAIASGPNPLRDYMAYPDLIRGLKRLEAAGRVAVDRTGSKGPSKWIIRSLPRRTP